MLAEALVIFACVNNTGCPDTSNLYFSQNPQIKSMIDKDAMELRQFVGPKIVDIVGQFLFLAAGGNGVIRLDKNLSLNANKSGGMLVFGINL
jgi:hypothetical protein